MKLPNNFDLSVVYPLELPVLKSKIQFKPYNIEQEKGLIMGKTESVKILLENYFRITKDCIVEGEVDFDNMSMIDFVFLNLHLRARSDDEIIPMEFKCKNEDCNKKFEFNHHITDSLKFENIDCVSSVLKVTDDLFLEIKPLSALFMNYLDEIETLSKNSEPKAELDFYRIIAANSIGKVIFLNDIYNDFTIDEINEKIISKLTKGNLSNIFKETKKLISMYMEFNITCPHCGNIHNIKEDNFLKFLN